MKKKFVSIRKKLLCNVTIVITCILLLSALGSYFYFRNIIESQTIKDQQQLMDACTNRMDGFLHEMDRISFELAGDQSIAEILNRRDYGESLFPATFQQLYSQILRYVQLPYSDSAISFQFILYLPDSLKFSSYLDSSIPNHVSRMTSVSIKSNSQLRKESWYQASRGLSGALYSFTLSNDSDTIYFCRTIQNVYFGTVNHSDELGMLVFKVSRSVLSSMFADYTTFRDSQIYLSYGNKSLCTNEGNALSSNVESAKIPYGNQFVHVTMGHTQYYAAKQRLEQEFYLTYLIPQNEISRSLNGIKILMALELMAGLLSGLLASTFLSFRLTKPIRYLTSMMQKVDSIGRMDLVPEEKASNDEIGVLFHQYNKMVQRIKKLMLDLRKSMQKQKESEIKALQAQINPHFVFNTLDSINWIAMCEGEKNISIMVTSLTDMLRYSITGQYKETSLQEELEYAAQYCRIQSLRYPDEFALTVDVPKELGLYRLPKMLLQPLVENSILHSSIVGRGCGGVEPLQIRVESELRNKCLILRVADSGAGNADQINDYLSGRETLIPKGNGFGIRNVNQRIQLLMGKEYGLSYIPWTFQDKSAGETIHGIAAELRLPPPKDE